VLTKCWHCGVGVETIDSKPSGQGVWAVIRVAGWIDEYDVALCTSCAQGLFRVKLGQARV